MGLGLERQRPPSLPGSVGGRSLRAAASFTGSASACRLCSAVGGSGKSAHLTAREAHTGSAGLQVGGPRVRMAACHVAGESSLTAALSAALAADALSAGTERATSSPCPRRGSHV